VSRDRRFDSQLFPLSSNASNRESLVDPSTAISRYRKTVKKKNGIFSPSLKEELLDQSNVVSNLEISNSQSFRNANKFHFNSLIREFDPLAQLRINSMISSSNSDSTRLSRKNYTLLFSASGERKHFYLKQIMNRDTAIIRYNKQRKYHSMLDENISSPALLIRSRISTHNQRNIIERLSASSTNGTMIWRKKSSRIPAYKGNSQGTLYTERKRALVKRH